MTMNMIRGIDALVAHLKEQGVPISRTTIFTLLKQKQIPHRRPAPRIVLFDLDKIEEWLKSKDDSEIS
ncbi:helix-turn-helix transcriptional regulator [Domibacillus enclensis]|uniref:AlpA family phage regulatory protein n=1 Tax=Domibacillus enclensis TaxID=1017273 RepID=A0A1N6WKF4_9BACI|nr:AlpA family phage regulatory protein [Domibacillus enclensis]OXS77964.1 AlpA family phage regulatory protein [Domibacillus enclensis]SIQ90542.1 Prophage CP4-57 regulatory protein (AlpA) [Domibacillus enclensis]